MAKAGTKQGRRSDSQPGLPRNDDIGEDLRLELFRLQFVIRQAEQRAYDLFLQNLVRARAISLWARRRSRPALPEL
jgi:hypothetical protein